MSASSFRPQEAGKGAASWPLRGLRRKVDRWFRPRELILRSDGRVSYLAISARQQKITVVFLLGFILWGGFATTSMIINSRQLATERSELEAAHFAYGRLLAQAERSYAQLLAYAQQLRGNLDGSRPLAAPSEAGPERAPGAALSGELRRLALDLQALTRYDGELTRTAAGLQGQLDAAKAENRALSQARQTMALELDNSRLHLAAELAAMRRDLLLAEDRRQTLAVQVLALQGSLSDVQQQMMATAAARSQAEGDLRRLMSDLRAGQASREALMAQIVALEQSPLDARQREAEGAAARELASREIARLKDALAMAEGEQRQLASRIDAGLADRQALMAQIAALEQGLVDARQREAEGAAAGELAARKIARLKDSLAAAGEDQRRLANRIDAGLADRQALAERITALEQDLASAQQRESTGALDREAAGKMIVQLLGQLDATRGDNTRLLLQTADARSLLARAMGEQAALQTARQDLADRIAALEDELATIQTTQQSIVDRLATRAHAGVGEVEKTVAMTGVDVDLLLSRARRELAGGEGGPFVPVRGSATAGSKLALASVASLDGEVGRLEALQLVLRTLPLAAPVDHYQLNSTFGIRRDPFNGRLSMHEGVDLANARLSPVLATSPGIVVFAGWKGSYGRMVEIDHGLGVHTRYGHLARIDVKVGETVDYRDQIGLLGSSGRSSGAHVHYEVRIDGRPLDPMNFLKAGRYVFKG
ncbi:MAG TPA: peptidoglycan DD-metalloendopeptidase family protein [Dongiaceae bacterium]|nr:peptidoglycan DD-metalloendopeptidase family protein [Dongiaceae bacterium]